MTQETAGPDTLQGIPQLLETRKTDTVYRDLYLLCTRTFFAPLLSHKEAPCSQE